MVKLLLILSFLISFPPPYDAPQPGPPVDVWPSQLTEGQVMAVLDEAGVPSELWPEFKAVWWCESRWRTDAVGDHGESLGAMQLWRGWFDLMGSSEEQWSDPVENVRVAYAVYQRYGWSQWTCKP